jgi:hypothetical protein
MTSDSMSFGVWVWLFPVSVTLHNPGTVSLPEHVEDVCSRSWSGTNVLTADLGGDEMSLESFVRRLLAQGRAAEAIGTLEDAMRAPNDACRLEAATVIFALTGEPMPTDPRSQILDEAERIRVESLGRH